MHKYLHVQSSLLTSARQANDELNQHKSRCRVWMRQLFALHSNRIVRRVQNEHKTMVRRVCRMFDPNSLDSGVYEAAFCPELQHGAVSNEAVRIG